MVCVAGDHDLEDRALSVKSASRRGAVKIAAAVRDQAGLGICPVCAVERGDHRDVPAGVKGTARLIKVSLEDCAVSGRAAINRGAIEIAVVQD